jgi:hypothetical protein
LQRDAWRLQRRIASLEENAAEICGFANDLVPGLLRTADYARAVFADGVDISPAGRERAAAEWVACSAVIEGAGAPSP